MKHFYVLMILALSLALLGAFAVSCDEDDDGDETFDICELIMEMRYRCDLPVNLTPGEGELSQSEAVGHCMEWLDPDSSYGFMCQYDCSKNFTDCTEFGYCFYGC